MDRHRPFRRRALTTFLAIALALASFPLAAGFAVAVSTDLVISQVYGGGGNSGSTWKNDFIELFNRGATAVTVTGWSVQYASATGSSWQRTNLSGAIQPGRYYLVREAQGAGGTQTLPTPDTSGTIAMAANAGKVALVTNQTNLTCATSCSSNAAVKDLVGYGDTASSHEGSGPTANLTNTTAALRGDGGCFETDDNAADFVAGAPDPRNSASPQRTCGDPPAAPRVREIQGAAHLSPMDGDSAFGVTGIVTAKRSNGFFFQDPDPDTDDATSEALFVFGTFAANRVSIGDAVRVNGLVDEFRPGGTGGLVNLTTTELVSASVTVASTGNPLPAPTVIGAGGRMPPTMVIEDDASGSVETSGVFDPASDGIDFYESLEAMLVQVNDAVAVSTRVAFGAFPREIAVVGDGSTGAAGLRTPRGGIVVRPGDFNPERILLSNAIAALPPVNVGDGLGDLVGVIDYSFGNFKLLVTATPTATPSGLAREVTATPSDHQIAVATFNVENLDPGDGPAKFDALAHLIVDNLRSPDLLALEEVQDDNGPVNDSTTSANVTLSTLVSAIQAVGGPTYEYRQIDPVDDTNGGEPGGNIRVAFLFRTDRGLTFVDRPGGGAATATTVVDTPSGPQLSASPGLIDPNDEAFEDSRKPLAGEFRMRGKTVFVVANHFNSKGGDEPLFGRFQPPSRPSEIQRGKQATRVAGLVEDIFAVDPNANVIVLGDLNDFGFSEALGILEASGLTNLAGALPDGERYSFIFDGNSQALDHILVSDNLRDAFGIEYDIVHVNTEFTDRASDHDPQVARLDLRGRPTPKE